MKIIDLYNKIAKGEEVPKTIHCVNNTYIWNKGLGEYCIKDKVFGDLEFYDLHTFDLLNATVEIIEDTPKVQVEMTHEEFFEYLDRKLDTPKEDRRINVCGSLFTKSEYDELAKSNEDKKIEKLGAFNIKKFYDDYPETAHFILAMFKKQEELIEKVNGDFRRNI